MLTNNLKNSLQILKSALQSCHDIFTKAMDIFNNNIEFKHFYSNSKRYLFEMGDSEYPFGGI